uniref:Uncharacterized protein n=1 Tax=Helianthus annuus TaxID=4232 RepID=A0A251RNI7_HELAN
MHVLIHLPSPLICHTEQNTDDGEREPCLREREVERCESRHRKREPTIDDYEGDDGGSVFGDGGDFK